MWMELIDGGTPKRGDLVQTNVGNRRERTWIILKARRMGRRKCKNGAISPPRHNLWMVRWWELEPETRIRLYASATRNGGQTVFHLKRYPPTRRKTKEQEFFSRR